MPKRNSNHQARMRARIAATKAACHICGQPIAWEANHLDPKSFVIDHVVSLARGGADELSNVRAAHRRQP